MSGSFINDASFASIVVFAREQQEKRIVWADQRLSTARGVFDSVMYRITVHFSFGHR